MAQKDGKRPTAGKVSRSAVHAVARAAIKQKIGEYIGAGVEFPVTTIARELGVNTAHISLVNSGKRRPSPTLIRAMTAAGWINPEPYPYYKIRRDDAEHAARHIVGTLGIEYAADLVRGLFAEFSAGRAASEIARAIGFHSGRAVVFMERFGVADADIDPFRKNPYKLTDPKLAQCWRYGYIAGAASAAQEPIPELDEQTAPVHKSPPFARRSRRPLFGGFANAEVLRGEDPDG